MKHVNRKQAKKKLLASIGYDPLIRKFWIDKIYKGRLYRFYTFSKSDIERYISTKSKEKF